MSVVVAKTVYTCDKGVCRCVKVSLFVCKERLAGRQRAFTRVTGTYVGVTEGIYTCDRNVCRGDRGDLHA